MHPPWCSACGQPSEIKKNDPHTHTYDLSLPLVSLLPNHTVRYDALVRAKMAAFGPLAVAAALKFYPHQGEPELAYSSLSSDIGVNCPNNVVAKQIAQGRSHGAGAGGWRGAGSGAKLYRYVFTARPSHPMAMFGSPHHAR